MEERMTLKEFEHRWRELPLMNQEEGSVSTTAADNHNDGGGSSACVCDGGGGGGVNGRENKKKRNVIADEGKTADDDDPFDCSSLTIPTTFHRVDEVTKGFVQEWRDLEGKKIINEGEPARKVARTTNSNEKAMPWWYGKYVRLPEQFDYASRRPNPPVTEEDENNDDDRVISLDDPTITTSYHNELWNLFYTIPTAELIDDEAFSGRKLPCMQQLYRRVIGKGSDNFKGRALSRLRMSDRHEYPPTQPTPLSTDGAGGVAGGAHSQHQQLLSTGNYTTTIRFECWLSELKRGVSPDPDRMVIEILGSQTLLDFHIAIAELTDDELWNTKKKPADNNKELLVDGQQHKLKKENEGRPGFFFMEGTFYTKGKVDYLGPIQQWLFSGDAGEKKARAKCLGLVSLSSNNIPIKSMSDIRLDDLPLRLGVRYVHVNDGNIEYIVFATDRRFGPKRPSAQYPLLHDTWTRSYIEID